MSRPGAATVHAARIQALVEASDWAGLARYWMAHQHREAADQAVALLDRRAATSGEPWGSLARYLADVCRAPFSLDRQLPEAVREAGSDAERATLVLLRLYPPALLCEHADQLPESCLQAAVAAAQQAYGVADGLADQATSGFFRFLMGRGLQELGRLPRAEEMYGQALAIRRDLADRWPEVYRPDLAMTLSNRAIIQRTLNQWEAARESYQETLSIYRPLALEDPTLYRPCLATALNGLGNVQADLNELPAARDSYWEALAIRSDLAREGHAAYQRQLADTLNNLAIVQGELDDLEGARASYQQALRIYRRLAEQQFQANAPHLASLLNNLGTVQKAMNQLEAARSSYQEALSIRSVLCRERPDAYQTDLATTLSNLGNVLMFLGDLEAARTSYRAALTIYQPLAEQQPATYQPDFAMVLNNLGTVQWALNDLNRAGESFQRVLDLYQPLADQRPEVYDSDLAMALNNLGAVQRALNNLEEARDRFRRVLAIYRLLVQRWPAVYQPRLARALVNLGLVQSDLDELASAQEHFTEALRARRELARQRPEVYQPEIAATLTSLGMVQSERGDEEGARESYQEALAIYRPLAQHRPEVFRPKLARPLNNLGASQRALGDWESARESFQQALTVYQDLAQQRPDGYRADLARTLNNLGTVQRETEPARDCYQRALDLYNAEEEALPTAHLRERQGCWNNLGLLYLRESAAPGRPDRGRARDAFRAARNCAERFRERFVTPRQRQRVQGEALLIYENLFLACVDLAQESGAEEALQEAVDVAEASRARNLMELLADEALQPANTPAPLVEEFRTRRRLLRQAERRLQDEESRLESNPDAPPEVPACVESASPGARGRITQDRSLGVVPALGQRPRSEGRLCDLQQELARIRQADQELLARIQADHDREFNPDQPVPPITFSAVRELLSTDVPTAIVQCTLTRERGLALLITRDELRAVALPHLDERRARELASAWSLGYQYCQIRHNTEDPNRVQNAEKALREVLPRYEFAHGSRSAQAVRELLAGGPTWAEALPALLEPVAERAVRPVVEALAGRGIGRLILSPNRALHVFPLHACTLADGRYLSDAFEVVYTPSLSILHRCAARRRTRRSRLFLVENPTCDLRFTEVEGACLRQCYPEHRVLYGAQATRDRILRESGDCHVLSYAGHAGFDPQDPLNSALVLGHAQDRGQWLTLRDVFCGLHLKQNLLTVLSGCESGMVLPDRVDEYVGLPGGFLYAGAACVLSTLWSVSDLSSSLLMDHFHTEWRGDTSIAGALHAAQCWLRGIPSGPVLRDRVLPGLLARLDDDHLKQQCARRAEYYAERFPDRPPFASPVHWAPFTATGLSYPLPPDAVQSPP